MSETNEVPERIKPLRSPKKPSLQKKVKYSTEVDLWNLEDATPIELEMVRADGRRQSHIPPIQPKPQPDGTDSDEPTVEDLESGPQPSQPATKEKDSPIISAKNRFSSSRSQPLPYSIEYKPQESNDLWATFDDSEELPTDHSATESVTLTPLLDEPKVIHPEKKLLPSKQVATEEKKSILEEKIVNIAAIDSEIPTTKENDAEISDVIASNPPSTPYEEPNIERPKKASFLSSFSVVEKIACTLFIIIVLGAAAGAFIWFKRNIKESSDPYAMPSFPLIGKHVAVDAVDTYWRAPVKTGANADPVQFKVISIPELSIRFTENSPMTGTLRVKYIDGDGNIVGDTNTKSLDSPKYQAERIATFACTAGFTKPEDIDSYLATVGKPWKVEVYEAENRNAAPQDYKLLFSAPISKTQK